ncbi:DUF397 domain-containing protein [Streptomyces sp. SPB074]|uniref:DUF397 domain-containing protein n=1 Tax=Streptomyces sp. (strain SPB074) TaxID=465543 RepID=UPI00055C084B|nr:DUF397 domain-containing protein [Streptomyces sp. SPB074]
MPAPEIEPAHWRKSSHSGDANGQCVEFADVRPTHAAIALRDSKNTPGPAPFVSPTAFTAFLADVAGRG